MTSEVSVIGLGKLGSSLAAVLSSVSHNVVGVDRSKVIVDQINDGLAPFPEPYLQYLIDSSPFQATTNVGAIFDTDLTFVIVPSPSLKDGSFDPTYVVDAVTGIGEILKEKSGYHNVVVSSTLMPGTMENVVRPALEQASEREVGNNLGLCYSPEFIALGNVVQDLLNPDMVLIGASDPKAASKLASLLVSVVGSDRPIYHMGLTEAEMAKIGVNAYITMKISFANTIAEICEQTDGADASRVLKAIGADKRIGSKYLSAGTAYGGECFPRDNRAFAFTARTAGTRALLAEATDAINDRQIDRLQDIIQQHMTPDGSVAIIGVTYKPGTPIFTEAVGFRLAQGLLADGIEVRVWDAAIQKHDRIDALTTALPGVVWIDDPQVVVQSAEVTVITTPEDPEIKDYDQGFVIDCWGVLPDASYTIGVG